MIILSRFNTVTALAMIGVLMVSCNQDKPEKLHDEEVIVGYAETGDSLLLSATELTGLSLKANEGDGEAAYAIFLHYSFVTTGRDHASEKAQNWLKKPAGLGFEEAQRHLANRNNESVP